MGNGARGRAGSWRARRHAERWRGWGTERSACTMAMAERRLEASARGGRGDGGSGGGWGGGGNAGSRPAVGAHSGSHGGEAGGGARHCGAGGEAKVREEAATRRPPPPSPTSRSVSVSASSASADRPGELRFRHLRLVRPRSATPTRSRMEKRTAVHADRPPPSPRRHARGAPSRVDQRSAGERQEKRRRWRSAMLTARSGLPAVAPCAPAIAAGRRAPVTPAARHTHCCRMRERGKEEEEYDRWIPHFFNK